MTKDIIGKEIIMVGTELISENPFQPRKNFNEEEIDELCDSIKTHGLLQPIILRAVGERYQIVAGERRLRASKKAGFAQVPAIIMEIDGVDVAEVSLIENIQRKNLNCLEEAEAFNILKIKFGMTAQDIAKRIGKSRPYVSNAIRLVLLPDQIKNALAQNIITMGHGRAILGLEDDEGRKKAFESILKDSLSVRQTEELITKMSNEGKGKKERKRKTIPESLSTDFQEYYNGLRNNISEMLGNEVKADIFERETDDYFEIVIRLPK